MPPEKSLTARTAVLEEKVHVMETTAVEIRGELHTLNETVRELVIYARLSKRFVGVIVTLGPALGVALAKLFQ